MTRRQGLTLIEMLAVIGMIAVLAAILFPVFAKAREKARASSCLNNETNIAVALRFYASDHGGLYPPVDDDLTPIIDRYCRNETIFQCPSSSQMGIPMGAPASPPPPVAEEASATTTGPAPGATMVQGPPPGMGGMPGGGMPPLGPSVVGTNYYYRAGMAPSEWPAAPMVSDQDTHHNNRANVVFTDGHAGRMGADEWARAGFKPVSELWVPAAPMGGMGMP